MPLVRVLLLGGTGLFGTRLADRLSRQAGLTVLLAGRNRARAETLAASLLGRASPVVAIGIDASLPDFEAKLRDLRPSVLVHLAGPFQGQDYHVARACIATGVHYADLADGRDFVRGIATLDVEAKAAGVAVLSGASSVPALSSAAADRLAHGMRRVRCIDIGISPGNRTERGLSTVQSVLGYCGAAIGSRSGDVHGWSGTWKHRYSGLVGERCCRPAMYRTSTCCRIAIRVRRKSCSAPAWNCRCSIGQ